VDGRSGLKKWLTKQPKSVKNWITSVDYKAAVGALCLVPGKQGTLGRVLLGVASELGTWDLAKLPSSLPHGRYYLDDEVAPATADNLALGWALGTYAYTRYKSRARAYSELVLPANANEGLIAALAGGICLGRDLINTPAADMGPAELADATRSLAKEFSGKFRQIVGDKLLAHEYPAIHAVGRASSRPPRLLDMTWGDAKHPKVTLVGKGVCFDTGGLDLKPADSMKLMKKDMGGAATVLAVARAVMQLGVPIRLRVLIPAVENSVSGDAMRPLDVLDTRKGITVEVGHTDAEGRLVLSDALAEASTENPELLLDIATLTGAARVALGTSLPALFSSSDKLADDLLAAGEDQQDPLWRLPLFEGYRRSLDSKVAQLSNISPGPYGGAITAALFLREFVGKGIPWAHIDTMAYNLGPLPGRPQGGEVFAVRAVVEFLRRRYPTA
jgi:leucyl aminopeptidase